MLFINNVSIVIGFYILTILSIAWLFVKVYTPEKKMILVLHTIIFILMLIIFTILYVFISIKYNVILSLITYSIVSTIGGITGIGLGALIVRNKVNN